MLELEARFEVQGRPVLIVGWFEGSGTGRIVVTGPNTLREDVQVSVDLSLVDEVQRAMSEPPPSPSPRVAVRAHLTVVTDQGRATRTTEVSGTDHLLDALCMKLLTMAELMTRTDALKRIVAALIAGASQRQTGPR